MTTTDTATITPADVAADVAANRLAMADAATRNRTRAAALRQSAAAFQQVISAVADIHEAAEAGDPGGDESDRPVPVAIADALAAVAGLDQLLPDTLAIDSQLWPAVEDALAEARELDAIADRYQQLASRHPLGSGVVMVFID